MQVSVFAKLLDAGHIVWPCSGGSGSGFTAGSCVCLAVMLGLSVWAVRSGGFYLCYGLKVRLAGQVRLSPLIPGLSWL